MGRLAYHFSMLGIAVLLVVSVAWAQQDQNQQQTQSGQKTSQKTGGQSSSSPELPQQPLSQEQTGQQQATGQTSAGAGQTSVPPLTGAEQYTLSTMGAGHSYVIPIFQFGQSVTTSGTGAFGTSTVDPVTTLSGLFTFHHIWSHYDFDAQYAGSGFIYNQKSALNTSAHQFSFSQRINGRRSSFLLTDMVTYLPESSFGYARLPGFNNFGTGGYGLGGLYGGQGNLDTNFLPGQSLLTGPSSQVGNSVVGEYDYQTSPLSSWTFTGSYLLLRFPNSSFIEDNTGIFRIGYNRALTPKSSMGLSYQGGIFRYGSSGGDFTNHEVTVLYSRTLSKRLGLELGAGPQFNVFSETGQSTNVGWQANGTLNYQLQRASVGLNYWHYTSAGSGVYVGAQTDDVGLYFATALSRLWSVNSDMGYSYNKSLQSGNLPGYGNSYNSWYGYINLNRTLNRSMSMFFSYNLQQQLANVPTCVGNACGTFYTQQYFSFGFNWHPNLGGYRQ